MYFWPEFFVTWIHIRDNSIKTIISALQFYYDIDRNRKIITETVKEILKAGTFPVIVGGDHSITYPCICAFENYKSLDIIQIDAHLDWIDG